MGYMVKISESLLEYSPLGAAPVCQTFLFPFQASDIDYTFIIIDVLGHKTFGCVW